MLSSLKVLVANNMRLAGNLAFLGSAVLELKADRDSGPLRNNVYEEIEDMCILGRRAVARDTRVNYPARAESELMLLQKRDGAIIRHPPGLPPNYYRRNNRATKKPGRLLLPGKNSSLL